LLKVESSSWITAVFVIITNRYNPYKCAIKFEMDNKEDKQISRRSWLGNVATASVTTALLGSSSPVMSACTSTVKKTSANDLGARTYNIRDFGAKGDGKTLDTKAIQAAVDACFADRGGIVLVPAGVFVTGTVELKSNVTLRIAAQGKILGTADGKQYYAAAAIPLDTGYTMNDGNVGLFFAANAENITIEGTGTIDGQGAQFRSPSKGVLPPAGIMGNNRPYHVLFYKCTNIIVRDLFLKDCAYHSVRVCFCSYVKINGLHIHSKVIHNNDGFHFIASEYVHVSDCDVECQDDACALFGSCKFVTVTNCTFSTRWSVFRFGGGQAENITISNCIIYEAYGCPIKMRCSPGSRFENITFSNLIMKEVTGPFSIGLGTQPSPSGGANQPPGIVRNISFNNIQATVVKPVHLRGAEFTSNYNPGEMFSCVVLNGMDDSYLEDIRFNDVHITYPGGGTAEQGTVRDVPKIAGEYYQIGVPPAYGLYARNVRGLTMHNTSFKMQTPDLRPAIILDNVSDASIAGLSAQGHPDVELMRFIGVHDVLLSSPRVLTPVSVFLNLEGTGNTGITIDGGDLRKAGKPVKSKIQDEEKAIKIRL
jgi:hypothetical protein